MTEEKAKRLIISTTVGAILLLFMLISVMVYQLIAIRVENNKKAELESKIIEYNRLIESGEDTLEARSTKAWIIMRARELGYKDIGDITLP